MDPHPLLQIPIIMEIIKWEIYLKGHNLHLFLRWSQLRDDKTRTGGGGGRLAKWSAEGGEEDLRPNPLLNRMCWHTIIMDHWVQCVLLPQYPELY